jgi:hypothetical protein
MKNLKIGLLTIALLALTALAGLTPRAAAQSVSSAKWTNATFTGPDPYYCPSFSCTVTAYKTGLTTATLLIRFTNNNPGASIKVISAQLGMDWGNNYTASGISNSSPLTIGAGLTGSITIPVNPIPPTSVASNLVLHAFIPSWSIVKYNITGISGTQTTNFSNIPEMAVYSSDQADAIAAWQQVSFLSSSSGFGIALAFRTPQGSSLFQQASQQFTLGQVQLANGNFTAAKANFASAVSFWNQAVSAENSHGNTLELNNGFSSYGSLMLGVGAIVGGVGAIVYAIRRPKALKTP